MNRFLAILLIPLFVIGNFFANVRCVVAEHSRSKCTAHIHFGGGGHHKHDGHDLREHSHHDHHHPKKISSEAPGGNPSRADDHDSDAVYFVAADSLFKSSERFSVDLENPFPRYTTSSLIAVEDLLQPYHEPRLSPFVKRPLYLLHAALRL